jgi:Coenzyme PQQ synthesis protein D (PqqD)
MTALLDRTIRIPDHVLFRELDGEAVILNLESGVYFGLDPVGTRVWQLSRDLGSLDAVWRALQEEFDASPQELEADLTTFVSALSSRGLVVVA